MLNTTLNRDFLIAWAAGFLDGEGTIAIFKRNAKEKKEYKYSQQYSLRLSASQADPAPLVRLSSIFGGSVRVLKRGTINYRQMYEWQLGHKSAVLVIEEMLPYFTVKHDQAELAIEFSKLLTGQPITEESLEKREAFYKTMKSLKHIDYDENMIPVQNRIKRLRLVS